MDFGSFLRQLRLDAGMSQVDVVDSADARGVTQNALSKWERGVGQPNPGQFEAIARAIGISDDDRLKALELAASSYPQTAA